MDRIFDEKTQVSEIENSVKKTTKFIEIDDSNKIQNDFKTTERVLIFDIDQTLYRAKQLDIDEIKNSKSVFFKLNNKSESENEYLWNYFRSIKLSWIRLFCHLYHKNEVYYEVVDSHDFGSYFKADPELKDLLNKIKCKKYCFTNSSPKRAEEILKILDLENYFDFVFSPSINSPIHKCIFKPMKDSYKFVEDYLGIEDSTQISFYDDNRDNVEAASEAGWNGFLINDELTIKNYLKETIENQTNQKSLK